MQKDITDGLSDEELEELRQLIEEPDDKDTMTWEEYKKATEKWRRPSDENQ
jgi:succinate dehydrogenase flavin-adding protein (antitoxin of CptAB toxin-antitoxin module)